jgi:diguanylate cyclase (GGDEF)-like protein
MGRIEVSAVSNEDLSPRVAYGSGVPDLWSGGASFAARKRPRVLCVDDDAENLFCVTAALEEFGFETRSARSGEDAVEVFRGDGADLVVLDLGLPGMDGVATCRALRASSGSSLPVIFLTGCSDVATRVRILDAGGDDYCMKPFLAEELAARVRVHLRRRDREKQLEIESRQYRSFAYRDPLTELGNRRAFDADLAREWARHERHGRALALLIADVDRFKEVNDRFGHGAGDTLLQSVGQSIAHAIRLTDFAFRQGGDEFAVLMPDTDGAGALAVAERVRQAVSHEAPRMAGPISLSIGVATALDSGVHDVAALVAAADRSLYAAKDAGRDRVVTVPSS